MNYSSLGKKYGVALTFEVVNDIQAALEKRVSAYISRRSKRISPIEAEIIVLQSDPPQRTSSAIGSKDEYDRIADARAASYDREVIRIRTNALEEAKKSYKAYATSLESYVKKAEQKSDWQYQRFLLGAAKRGKAQKPAEPIGFKSQVYEDYKEKMKKEVDGNGL